MVVRRSWLFAAVSLIAVVLVACGYWLWRPARILERYIPTNNHLIIGFGSDYLHNNVADIDRIPLGSWQQNLLTYTQDETSIVPDQLERLAWTIDPSASNQAMVIQLRQSVSKQQQERIRSQLIGKPTPLLSGQWQEVLFAGPMVIMTTDPTYQFPTKPHALSSVSHQGSVYLLWDQPWPQSLRDMARLGGLSFIAEQAAGAVVFDSRTSLQRLIVRLPSKEAITQRSIPLPPITNFDVYVAGQTEAIATLKNFPFVKPWYEALERSMGQRYGLSLATALKSFGTDFLFLLQRDHWLTQSSTSSLQQVVSSMSGYFQPVIKAGRLPDGTKYQELVRSEVQSSTTTIAGQAVHVWKTGQEQSLYQYDQSGQSAISNTLDLLTPVIAQQQASGDWQACLPPDKVIWTTMIWLQTAPEQGTSTIIDLPSPWKSVGMVSGHSDSEEVHVFCLL